MDAPQPWGARSGAHQAPRPPLDRQSRLGTREQGQFVMEAGSATFRCGADIFCGVAPRRGYSNIRMPPKGNPQEVERTKFPQMAIASLHLSRELRVMNEVLDEGDDAASELRR